MIFGKNTTSVGQTGADPRGFDDFELKLGDVMRGERATKSKSLLDVQRELRIRASLIAAIENGDLEAFDTPGFVSGYVRSYARYLGLDPEWTFDRFCEETGFRPMHGMAPAASGGRSPRSTGGDPAEALASPNPLFLPPRESMWTRFEPRALGSVVVLAALVGALGYAGWSVLKQIQTVNLAAVEDTPGVVAQLDPLDGVTPIEEDSAEADLALNLPRPEAVDRIYRPQALDVPVLTPRDGPIASVDPAQAGALAGLQLAEAPVTGMAAAVPGATPGAVSGTEGMAGMAGLQLAVATGQGAEAQPVRTVAPDAPEVEILAVRPSWVRVRSADGTVIFEKILDAGERFALPKLEEPPTLRAGNSGSVYFAVNGQTYGPAAPGPNVVKNLALSAESLTEAYALADLSKDEDLAQLVAMAALPVEAELPTGEGAAAP